MPKNVNLRSISNDHIKETYEWISDPEFQKIFMIRGKNSWEKHTDYFDKLIRDETQQGYAIFLDNQHIGNCGLKYMNNIEKSAELWIYIGIVSKRNIGLGSSDDSSLIDFF